MKASSSYMRNTRIIKIKNDINIDIVYSQFF